MGAIDAINNYNFFMKPVNGVDGIGQNGGSARVRRVERIETTGGDPSVAISKIDRELHPDNSGSTFLYGINKHGKNSIDLLG